MWQTCPLSVSEVVLANELLPKLLAVVGRGLGGVVVGIPVLDFPFFAQS